MLDLIICALAVWEVLEIWRHSAIMASWRERVRLWEGFFGELLRCPFCLAPWLAFGVVLPCFYLPCWTAQGYAMACTLGFESWLAPAVPVARLAVHLGPWMIWAFAVARLANAFNDVGYRWCRTFKHDQQLSQPAAETSTTEV